MAGLPAQALLQLEISSLKKELVEFVGSQLKNLQEAVSEQMGGLAERISKLETSLDGGKIDFFGNIVELGGAGNLAAAPGKP